MFFERIVSNISLLIVLSFVYSFLYQKKSKIEPAFYPFISGLLFGGIAIVGMLVPLYFVPGIIFDGRSIVISVGAFLGGPVVAGVAVIMAGIYRLMIGGSGSLMGLGVIVTSAALGLLYRQFVARNQSGKILYLYFFGLAVHVAMLLWMFALPGNSRPDVFLHIAFPVLILYPVATVLLAKIILELENYFETLKKLVVNEEKYRVLFETKAEGVVYQNVRGEIISANPAAERILGLSLDQLKGRTSIDPRWKAVDKNKNDLPGESHPAMIALRTGKEVQNFIQGIYSPITDTYVWILVNSVPQFNNSDEKPFQVFSTFTDITERIYAEDELRKLKNELEKQVEEKTSELRKRVNELEMYYEATVEREIRMGELREKINEIKNTNL